MHASKRVARLQARGQTASTARAAIAMVAAGYIRVSTEEQATHGHGLESGDRPGYGALIGKAAAQNFSVLLVWKFDRLARNIVYAVTAVNELAEQHGVVIRSVTEPIDTATAMGGLVVDEGEAEVVRRIFDLAGGGLAHAATTRNIAATSSICSAGAVPSSTCCRPARTAQSSRHPDGAAQERQARGGAAGLYRRSRARRLARLQVGVPQILTARGRDGVEPAAKDC